MRLVDRLRPVPDRATAPTPAGYEEARQRIHARLLERVDLRALGADGAGAAPRLRALLGRLVDEERLPLNRAERARLVSELQDEILGLGPLEPFLRDESVQDILVNGPEQVYVERGGVLERTAARFRDREHLMAVIDRVVAEVGRRVDESSPMVDARLPDGSRVNVILPPLSLAGPVLSIRRFGREPLGMEDLLGNGTLVPEMARFLEAAVVSRLGILISGGTGTGKTTLLNALSGFIPEGERIITIEDSAELRLRQPHVVPLEARPPNVEGRGEVTLADLVKNSLRMRPDRIVVGEVRGAEVLDMLQAMNTGHPGSMSTVHANSPRDALWRLEVMAAMAGHGFPERALRALLASAIQVVVQLARFPDGSRRVVSISEMAGAGAEPGTLRELFVFEQSRVEAGGRVAGRFRGLCRPERFDAHLRVHGFDLPDDLFRVSVAVEG